MCLGRCPEKNNNIEMNGYHEIKIFRAFRTLTNTVLNKTWNDVKLKTLLDIYDDLMGLT